MVDATKKNKSAGEEPSLYHIIKVRRRQRSGVIKEIIDDEGNAQTTSGNILKAFSGHFLKTFESMHTEMQCINKLVSRGMRCKSPEMKDVLTTPISEQEL